MVTRLTPEYLAGHPTGTSSHRQGVLPWLDALKPADVVLPPCMAPCPPLIHDFADEVFALVNQHRTGMGLNALARDVRLDTCEEWKQLNEAANAYMDHDDHAPPIERTVAARFADYYPVGSVAWGENLAYGFVSPASVMQAWLSDVGHRSNVENESWVGIGVAVSQIGPQGWDGKGTGAGVMFQGQAFGSSPVVVPSRSVLDQWLNHVLPLIAATSQYQKWLASTTKAGKADVAKWNAYLTSPHASPPAMATPYGKALVADLALAASQP